MLVLSSALIVSVVGLSALLAVRVQRRGARDLNSVAAARLNAQAAIELGLHWIATDPNWRDTRPNGVWAADVPAGRGTLTVEGTDPDGLPLNNDAAEPLLLTGTGVAGEARYKLQVSLTPQARGFSCLEAALHAGGNLEFIDATVNSDQLISSNSTIAAVGSTQINADVEAVVGISGGSFNGAQTAGVDPRTTPDPVAAFDFYSDPVNGTYIDYASLPAPFGSADIIDVVLSPNSNPYGAGVTNPEGIYVIDCLGGNIGIQRARIVGTLVLLNVGTGSAIMGEVNWAPAVANYPSLLVDGNMRFQMNGAGTLSESVVGVNYNPPGTPYGGFSDLDTVDSYPSIIKGLVYISGDTLMQMTPVFDGVVVVGAALTSMTTPVFNFTYRPIFLNNPPPGFGLPPRMVVSPGSWRQVVD